MRKLLLVDGSSYLFRAFHKLPPLTGPKGQPTNAAVGVINMLKKLARDEEPSHVGIVFDKGGETFRHRLFPDYKKQRAAMPDELKAQVPLILDLVHALGFPLISIADVEADDVIATLAHHAEREGCRVLISTGDKDLGQLVNGNITLINTMENNPHKARMDEQGVWDKFQVRPAQIPDYLALAGDKADNIPGVPGVGPKVAADWLAKYGDLKGVIAHAGEVTGKRGEDLRATLDHLPLFLELATLDSDVKTEVALNDLSMRPPDEAALRAIYTEYGFSKWMKELETEGTPETVAPEWRVEVADDMTSLVEWSEKWQDAEAVAMEALSDDGVTCVGIAMTIADDVMVYVPLPQQDDNGADERDGKVSLRRREILARLRPWLVDARRGKIGCDMKRVRNILASDGIVLAGIADDVTLASYVLNSTAVTHNLSVIARHYLGLSVPEVKEIVGKGATRVRLTSLKTRDLANYAASRVHATWKLRQFFQDALEAMPRLRDLYVDMEMSLVTVLSDMERKGVCVDKDALERQSEELQVRMHALQERVHTLVGHTFNLSSPAQLGDVLFKELGMPVLKKTTGGKPSTAESVLSELARDYEVPRLILDYRSLSKLKSTYTDKLSELAGRDVEQRVHTTFHQAVTATGRLSSSEPNLQNIPVRSEEGRRIRHAFVAPAGRYLIAADYSQIELRVMAHLSGDARLCAAFEHGEDVHRATAAEIFSVSLEQVSPEQRRLAKAVNFGLIYGMTPFGLSRQLGISRQLAEEYYQTYFERYAGVVKFIEAVKARAKQEGYVETIFGRRLYVSEDIHSKNALRRLAAERAAINAPMQGTAADLIKRAMIDLWRWLQASSADADILLQVHDELVVEVATVDADRVASQCAQCMESACQLAVPLVVDIRMGQHWDEIH